MPKMVLLVVTSHFSMKLLTEFAGKRKMMATHRAKIRPIAMSRTHFANRRVAVILFRYGAGSLFGSRCSSTESESIAIGLEEAILVPFLYSVNITWSHTYI